MKIAVEKNVLLSLHTTLRVGGIADYFVTVTTIEELMEALQFARQAAVPLLVIGGGSNVLVSDKGYRGLVIRNKISGLSYKEEGVTSLVCGAGENFDDVVADSVAKGYWGLENLSSIPGTVGATPIQNVGAYGTEVSSLVAEVTAVNIESLVSKTFSNEECKFDYRDSFFKNGEGREWVVTEVVFELSKKQTPNLDYGDLQELSFVDNLTPSLVRDKIVEIRAGKFPDLNLVGTAGSFFKNPIISNTDYNTLKDKFSELPGYPTKDNKTKVPLGWILDNICNLKGFCQEGVCLYKKQALVLINETAKDSESIDKFAVHVASEVKEKTGIDIEREVRSV